MILQECVHLNKSLLSILQENINESYTVDVKENTVNTLHVVADYKDAYECETIEVLRVDEKIEVCVTRYNFMDDEIRFPEGCHECVYEECQYYNPEIEECTLEAISEQEMKEFNVNAVNEDISLGYGCKLNVAEHIATVQCYVNVTHLHYYKALSITLLTQSLEDVKRFLISRDIIFSIIRAYVSKCHQLAHLNKPSAIDVKVMKQ